MRWGGHQAVSHEGATAEKLGRTSETVLVDERGDVRGEQLAGLHARGRRQLVPHRARRRCQLAPRCVNAAERQW